LAEAQRIASAIFQAAGVRLYWVRCDRAAELTDTSHCDQTTDPLRLIVKVFPESMTARLDRPPRVFGLATQSEAYIFYGRVSEFVAKEGVSESVLLGHVLAHEVGHMALGQKGHSPSGVMSATFEKRALRLAERGLLLFTAKQSSELRARLRS
jgi:hypothetical protein